MSPRNQSNMKHALYSPDNDFLFVDIDDTITTATGAPRVEGNGLLLGQSLLWLMRQFAVQHNGISPAEAEQRIRHVADTVSWWHWSDFLRQLQLNGHDFWEFAQTQEASYLGPVEPGLPDIFEQLWQAGYRMFITSNNPSSGMLHKLRLAGLADIYGSRYFLQYFSPCDLHYMKSSPEFWQRTLTHSGLPASQIIVVGDSWNDDVLSPSQAGIQRFIHLNRSHETMPQRNDVLSVNNWTQIASALLRQLRQPSSAGKVTAAASA